MIFVVNKIMNITNRSRLKLIVAAFGLRTLHPEETFFDRSTALRKVVWGFRFDEEPCNFLTMKRKHVLEIKFRCLSSTYKKISAEDPVHLPHKIHTPFAVQRHTRIRHVNSNIAVRYSQSYRVRK